MEKPFFTSKPLDKHPATCVDQNTHAVLRVRWVISWAASPMEEAKIKSSPDSCSTRRPSSILVPSMRITTGRLSPILCAAFTMPRATISQRKIPPKIFISTPRTLLSASITSNPLHTISSVAPPPASRKLAGSAPACLIASMVAMARPAPLTMVPTYPLSQAAVTEKGVRLLGVGSFAITHRAARTGRNPRTGTSIRIPPRRVVKFTPARGLAEKAGSKDGFCPVQHGGAFLNRRGKCCNFALLLPKCLGSSIGSLLGSYKILPCGAGLFPYGLYLQTGCGVLVPGFGTLALILYVWPGVFVCRPLFVGFVRLFGVLAHHR
ncbi:hypothetical protein B566_EDAN019324 [Ephemera danica]|nr:hypothetical protein B566_EDAN019324 [Ephemera danica]